MTKRRYYWRFDLVSNQTERTQKELTYSERGKLPFQIFLTVSNIFFKVFAQRMRRRNIGRKLLDELFGYIP